MVCKATHEGVAQIFKSSPGGKGSFILTIFLKLTGTDLTESSYINSVAKVTFRLLVASPRVCEINQPASSSEGAVQ